MATAPNAPPTANQELRIVSHSTMFYWWPVWAIGFILFLFSYLSDQRMVTVPEDAIVGLVKQKADAIKPGFPSNKYEMENRFVLIVNNKRVEDLDKSKLTEDEKKKVILDEAAHLETKLHISGSKNPGVLFCIVLLLVITITNVPLRGLWSVIVIVFALSLAIIFAILGWWDPIFRAFHLLDIRINAGGYLVIALILFFIWLVIFTFFDRQIYMVFTPGQLRVRLEIGDAETAYDTTGMTIQKQRSDLFRHWILGLGSGDLIVRTAGAQAHQFDMPNVLFLGRKVKEIEDMLRSRQVVGG